MPAQAYTAIINRCKSGPRCPRKTLLKHGTRQQADGGLEEQLREGEASGRITGRLVELIRDELDEDTDLKTARMLMDLARIAWNLTVEPKEGEEARQRMLNHLPPQHREFVGGIVQDFKARKLELFPKDLRVVAATGVKQLADSGLHFTAATLGLADGSYR